MQCYVKSISNKNLLIHSNFLHEWRLLTRLEKQTKKQTSTASNTVRGRKTATTNKTIIKSKARRNIIDSPRVQFMHGENNAHAVNTTGSILEKYATSRSHGCLGILLHQKMSHTLDPPL